jgi:hypothetical protein
MQYVKVKNGTPYKYTIDQLFIDYPNADIYKGSEMPNSELLMIYKVFPLVTTSVPDLQDNEMFEEAPPKFINGEWYQQWDVKKLSEDEVNSIVAGNSVNYTINDRPCIRVDKLFLADKQLQENRLNICFTCPSLSLLKTCKECNCIVPFKVKFKASKCPLEKW